MRNTLALLAGAALLAGCAAPLPPGPQRIAEAQQAVAAAVPCCPTLAQARREPLPQSQPQPALLNFDVTAQAFDFDGRRSFFRLLELPPFSTPYAIVLTGVLEGPLGDATLFVPHLDFLDAEFRTTRSFDAKGLRQRGHALERSVFVNPSNAAERYLLIRDAGVALTYERDYSVVNAVPVVAGPVMFNLFSGTDAKAIVRASATGKLQIEAQGLLPPPTTPAATGTSR